jgi:hypothetical protein
MTAACCANNDQSPGSVRAVGHVERASAVAARPSRRLGTTAHALITRQPGGEPWASIVIDKRKTYIRRRLNHFVVHAHALPADHVARELCDAVRTMRPLPADGRIGILARRAIEASTATDPSSHSARTSPRRRARTWKIDPRRNASRRPNADPAFSAVAACRSLRERPDAFFADADQICVANDDEPSLDMPNETSLDIRDALLDAPITWPIPHYSRTGPTRYEHGRARSSEQLTPKPARSDGVSDATPFDALAAENLQPARRRVSDVLVSHAQESRTLCVALITV